MNGCTAGSRRSVRGCVALRIQCALEDLHLGAHLSRRLVAQIAVFLQRSVEDALELRRQVGIELVRGSGLRLRMLSKMTAEVFRRRLACRSSSRRACAERKQVGAPIEFFSPCLLG